MEKTRDQILIEKLRRVSGRLRGRGPHGPHGPGMLPHPGGKPCHGGPHGPGHGPHGPMFPRERVLQVVLDAGEAGIRQRDIAAALGINPSSLSEQIDRLEADRYLERRANAEDKRSTLIFLTEKGKARAYELEDERRKRAEDFCANLSDEEKDTLIALLDKLLEEQK